MKVDVNQMLRILRYWEKSSVSQITAETNWFRARSQAGLQVGTGASQATDLLPIADHSPVLDNGYHLFIIGISKASELAKELTIPLHVRSLDCVLFIHGYGSECANSNLLFSIWSFPTFDMQGYRFNLSLYVTVCSDNTLIGLELITQVELDFFKGTLILVSPDNDYLILPTYLDPPSVCRRRSYLSIFPSDTQAVVSLYSVSDSLRSKCRLPGQDNISLLCGSR